MKDEVKKRLLGKSDKNKLVDNAFEEAQDQASQGVAPAQTGKNSRKGGSKNNSKAKDELFRARDAEKEWSSESDDYRVDNA